jgi:hypothetical protein
VTKGFEDDAGTFARKNDSADIGRRRTGVRAARISIRVLVGEEARAP